MLGSRLSQRSRRELILRECTSDEGLEAVRKGELDLCLLCTRREMWTRRNMTTASPGCCTKDQLPDDPLGEIVAYNVVEYTRNTILVLVSRLPASRRH